MSMGSVSSPHPSVQNSHSLELPTHYYNRKATPSPYHSHLFEFYPRKKSAQEEKEAGKYRIKREGQGQGE